MICDHTPAQGTEWIILKKEEMLEKYFKQNPSRSDF